MKAGSPDLGKVIDLLWRHYGEPVHPPTRNPFELILLENVAYLAPPARRREAFELLRRSVGTTPEAILAAQSEALEEVTARGLLKSSFAARLRECAAIAIKDFGADLTATILGPIAGAKRALRSFPGIGEPGAGKILLFTGRQTSLAPESNGLRVLIRLGLVEEKGSYARNYAAALEVARDLPPEPKAMERAHLLLQLHGQTLCKRRAPSCPACPLAPLCEFALNASAVSDCPSPRS
jgi:endonuclease III